MKERDYLVVQETHAAERIQKAVLGGDGSESPRAALEQAAVRRPLMTVGIAAALGAVAGVLLRTGSGRKLVGGPIWKALRRKLF